jgi:hypothetical protein
MFTFQNVDSIAKSGTTVFRSTALVNVTAMISGSVVECRGGNRFQSVSIGNVSLCVIGKYGLIIILIIVLLVIIKKYIGQLPPPADVQCMNTQNGLMITWNAVTDTSCAESPVKYNVTVVRQSDRMVIDSLPDLDGNGTEINGTNPSIDYSVFISARTTIALCDGEVASILCKKSAAAKHLFTGRNDIISVLSSNI